MIRSDEPVQRGDAWTKITQIMPYQAPPVASSVAVTGSPVVWNPNILVDWANIVVDKLDRKYSIQQIFTKADLG